MNNSLTACFIGLGSIGRRHLKNLSAVCRERGIDLKIDAIRHAPSPLSDEIAPLVRKQYLLGDTIPNYDLMFICNPSQKHHETVLAFGKYAGHVFLEKPAFTRPLSDAELEPLCDERKFYVACPLRYTKTFHDIKSYVDTHRIYSVRAICSSYLPDWRPGVDYRKLYSASADSGGVKFDLIHELDYLISLFGFPVVANMLEANVSSLEIACSDLFIFAAKYRDKLVELHLDYFGRVPQRYCELLSSDGVVKFDFLKESENRNASYMREMASFIDFAIGGRTNINSIVHANQLIRLIS